MGANLKRLLLILIYLVIFSCAALLVDGKPPSDLRNLKYKMVFLYEESTQKMNENDFYRFHENLGRFYLDFAKGEHIRFHVEGDKIQDGAIIENEEESQGQRIKHIYHVKIDHERNRIEWICPNSKVFIKKWNITMEVATLLRFEIHQDKIQTELTIAFGTEKDLKAAYSERVDKIWEAHNHREMKNAFAIGKFLVESNQMHNNPYLWNIDGIRSALK